jgi:hypothetical protein
LSDTTPEIEYRQPISAEKKRLENHKRKWKCNRLLEQLEDRESFQLHLDFIKLEDATEFFDELKENSSLKSLTVRYRHLTPLLPLFSKDVTSFVSSLIADLLRGNSAITSIVLEYLGIGIEGTVSIFESLSVNTLLTSLYLKTFKSMVQLQLRMH